LKHEIARLSSNILYILSITYILGQAGLLELDKISTDQFIIRMVPGFIALSIATVIINFERGKNHAKSLMCHMPKSVGSKQIAKDTWGNYECPYCEWKRKGSHGSANPK
jgi:hypothetical protein